MVIYGNSYLHEKSPENTVFPGLFESDADGTRTRNHRIDSLSTDSNSTREKPNEADSVKPCLSHWLSEKCDSELLDWLGNCPVSIHHETRTKILRAILYLT